MQLSDSRRRVGNEEILGGREMHQLIFQNYYPAYNTFSFLLHSIILKKKKSPASPPLFLLHSLVTLRRPLDVTVA